MPNLNQFFDENWPTNGLENLGCCPLCGERARTLLHDELRDNVFHVAPGKWTMWACEDCSAAYLDPRPNISSIGLAYTSYYTHKNGDDVDGHLAVSKKSSIGHKLVNGYINWRYGAAEVPFIRLGIIALHFFPLKKQKIDHSFRSLPRRRIGTTPSLLDVGCGAGQFLKRAERCGWKALGLDLDEKAVEIALKDGLDVIHGELYSLPTDKYKFDAITLSHSLEHLHDPREALKRCWELLKPGGELWIETPNISSYGHECFGVNWRGIEAPRHLIIFNKKSLFKLLEQSGFEKLNWLPQQRVRQNIFKASRLIEHTEGKDGSFSASSKIIRSDLFYRIAGMITNERCEFLTIKCVRPKV